ncbi:hypothetical protein [Shewanella chilikensis]|uniref:hypothetical protein n=1 Tax=Shewanella chilikensis TaxID=558541 RepID=UPI0035EAC18C
MSAIFLTGSSLSLSLAFADGVFEGNGNIPFATDLDFLTERLWFKLNKGFGGDVVKPASFDPYIKAKIVLSSILSKSVSKVYSDMSEQYKDGKLNSENLAYLYAEIRNVPTNPDDVSNDTSYLSSDFLSDKYINDVIRSRQELEAKAIQGEEFKKKYFRETYEKKQLLLKPHKKNAFMTHFSIILLMVILLLVVIFLPLLFQSESDSLFTKLAYAWSAILTIISLVNAKKMNMYARKVAVSRYKKRKIK